MSDSRQSIKIAIIGGGPAGVSLCLQMFHALCTVKIKQKISLILFEKNRDVGLGTPYSLAEDAFCINLPQEYMVLKPQMYHHFSAWMSKRYSINSRFPPRHYFGKYANELFHQLPNNPDIEMITCVEHDVFDIVEDGENHYQIHAQHKNKQLIQDVDYVILAIGNLPFSSANLPDCISNPWDRQNYQNIDSKMHVGVIGTRLSAIDIVLKLKQQKHQGKITLVSRSGLLSSVRGEHPIPKMQYLVPKNIHHILQSHSPQSFLPALRYLLEQELAPYLPKKYDLWKTIQFLKKLQPIKRLRYEIQQAEQQNSTWQSILSCFYQIIYRIWPQLPLDQQQVFLENDSSFMFTFLCSFPLEKAYSIQSMMANQQLTIHGGLVNFAKNQDKFSIQLKNNKFLQCDHLFLATGSGSIPEAIPLLANMLKRNLIKKHALAGICINTHNYQVKEKNIYALGDLVKGACFKMIEVGQVVEQAQTIIQSIIKQIH